jgi:lysophospholipase L1-like esterase
MGVLGFPPSWGVELVVDGDEASATQSYSPPYDQTLMGVSLAEHTVEARLIDEIGNPVTPIETDVEFGVGDYYVAFGDSITRGVGDDIQADNTSADLRSSGIGFTPILNDQLTGALGYPHTVLEEGVSGSQSSDGVSRIPGVLAAHPRAQVLLVMFGTNDAWFVQRASGLGLTPGDPGYVGSYKDNMSRIIQAILDDGKEPVLAKAPNYLGNYGSSSISVEELNALVQEYNQVVDELVAAFGITVVPPDFYSHFAAHPEEFADDAHPNGLGYQSMSDLWMNRLVP